MKELIMLAIVFIYGTVEILIGLSTDPLYFMPIEGNEVKEILGLGTVAYVIVYTIFMCVWVNAFYVIPILWKKYVKKNKE